MVEQHTLLIVDDEEEIRENLCDFAEFKGFTVLQACNGLQALEILESNTPDTIVSDLMMPEMGGMQLLQELARRENDIPVVIMTAFGTMEYAIDAMKNGAADFLTKPIDLPYMLKVVDKILQRSAMQKKIKEQQLQLEDDLRHAASIQRCLLPDPIENSHLSIHYRFEPLIAIGGDYLTVHQYSPQGNDRRSLRRQRARRFSRSYRQSGSQPTSAAPRRTASSLERDRPAQSIYYLQHRRNLHVRHHGHRRHRSGGGNHDAL